MNSRKADLRVFHLLIHIPKSWNSWSCSDPNQGTGSFFQVSQAGIESKDVEPSSAAFPDHSQGEGWEVEQHDTNLPYKGSWIVQRKDLVTELSCWVP